MNINEFSEITNSDIKIKVLSTLKDMNNMPSIKDYDNVYNILQEFIGKEIVKEEKKLPSEDIYTYKLTKKGTQILEVLETINNI